MGKVTYLTSGVICAVMLVVYGLFVNWAGDQYNDYRNNELSKFPTKLQRWVSVDPFWYFWYGQLSIVGGVAVALGIAVVAYITYVSAGESAGQPKKMVACVLTPLLLMNR